LGPSWDKLINKILEESNIKTKERNLLRLASRLENKLGKLKFREKIIDQLTITPNVKSTLHDILVSLDINLFITTNYDQLLEDSFKKHGFVPQLISNDKDIPHIDHTKKTIVKLHGDVNSPSSLVITSKDYAKYKVVHNRFVEWLNSKVTQNTVLFIGTSFDDPRLIEADEHILNMFDEDRRQPFIVLKSPALQDSESDEEYEIELNDFKARCADFEERNFYVITVDKYDEINIILREIKQKALDKKIEENPQDLKSQATLQADHLDSLEDKLKTHLDKDLLKLCEKVRGHGCLPVPLKRIKYAEELIDFMEESASHLSKESFLEGYLTVADALLSKSEKKLINKSRQYYEKANEVFQRISNQESWRNRLLRVRAKLLFFEGKSDEAINSLLETEDEKSISVLLALFIDTKRLDEAYGFISNREVHPSWIFEALYILIYLNHVGKAEKIFNKTFKEFEEAKFGEKLEESPFKTKHFAEKICYAMAESLLHLSIRLSGKKEQDRIEPSDLTLKGKETCKKSLNYVDKLFNYTTRQSASENYFAANGLRTEWLASLLLGKFSRADAAAEYRAALKPIDQEVVEHIINKIAHFENSLIKTVLNRLVEDYPDQFWSYLCIAQIEAYSFKNMKKSWEALNKAANLIVSDADKQEFVVVAPYIGKETENLNELNVVIDNILRKDDLYNKFTKALSSYLKGEKKQSRLLFSEVTCLNPPPKIEAITKQYLAEIATSENQLTEARKLLEEAKALNPTIAVFEDLLLVYARIGDDNAALELAEKIELVDEDYWEATHVKAQSSRNLGLFDKSEKAWRKLREKFPAKPEFAYGLAEVLTHQTMYDEALKELDEFINNDDKFHPNCLSFACQIHISAEKYSEAFALLDAFFDRIQDDYNLLLMYMDLGYRTGNEEKSHEANVRLEKLSQEGKVPEDVYFKKSLNEIKDWIIEKNESDKKLKDLYRTGQIARLLLADRINKPFYLDWAVRTQGMHDFEPNDWIDYIIYSTNGLRVQFNTDARNQFAPILVPQDVKEIVIDHHALITIHRLGLMDKLGKYYSKIFYPAIIKDILSNDQKRFISHQISYEKSYRKTKERLERGQLKEAIAQVKDGDKFNLSIRNLNLANLENIILVDSYLEDKGFEAFPKVTSIQLSQLAEWLYEKGKIRPKQWADVKKLFDKNERWKHSKDFKEKIEEDYKIIVAETTLQLMEQYGLVEPICNMGLIIYVERFTANSIKNTVGEYDFGEKVGDWNRDLKTKLASSNLFQEIMVKLGDFDENQLPSPCAESLVSSLTYAEDNALYLLTDDRFVQMLRSSKMSDMQFGTDALLLDLYGKRIIEEDEYAEAVLELCKWRYRFLLPAACALTYFARQYKDNLPGDPLKEFARYFRQCMKDTGLFLGPEPTNPPLPMGFKYFQEVVYRWIELLTTIWQNAEFDEQSRLKLSNWVYRNALPEIPQGILPEVRKTLAEQTPKTIILKIFLSTLDADDPFQLHGLLELTFEVFHYSEESKLTDLKSFLASIDENKAINKKLKFFLYRQALKAFAGTKEKYDPSLRPYLSETEEITQNISPEEAQKIISQLNGRKTYRKTLPQHIPAGPLIALLRDEGNSMHTEIIDPADLMSVSNYEVRSSNLEKLLEPNKRGRLKYVSDYTINILRNQSEAIKSGDSFVWLPAAKAASDSLKKDFFYALNLFKQAASIQSKNLSSLVNKGWRCVLEPSLDSVLKEIPLLSKWNYNIQVWAKKRTKEIEEENKNTNQIIKPSVFLDWFLKEVYFLPFSAPLNPWNIIKNSNPFHKDSTFNNVHLLESTSEWIKDKDDPMAYLVALDVILNLRTRIKGDEEEPFKSDKFYNLLDSLFKNLLLEDDDVQKKIFSATKVHAVWRMRKELAKYYTQYIDLNTSEDIEDERRVIAAWWMAREVANAILESSFYVNMSLEDQIEWINEKTDKVLKTQTANIHFSHLYKIKLKHLSPSRYYTFHGTIQLPAATLALLMMQDSQGEQNALNGLMKPSKALSSKYRDAIISNLHSRVALGEGQLYSKEKPRLPILWNTSICYSAPSFLKAYYGDALTYLGKDKVQLIQFVENLTAPDFLNRELLNLSDELKKLEGASILLLITSLKVYVLTHGEMPEKATVIRDNTNIVQQICKLEEPLNWYCISNLSLSFRHLLSAGDLEWSETINQLFSKIEYDECNQNVIETIVLSLTDFVILGQNISIMKPIFDKITSNKYVRKTLGRLKPMLQYTYPLVSVEHREQIKEILNQIEDIPIVEE